MNADPHLIDARHMGQSFATDRDLAFPLRPRLIPELLVLPLASGGLLFAGSEEPQVLRGKSIGRLRRLLPLLDGERSLNDIAAAHPDLSPADLHDMVSLLFSRGLLEDGRPAAPMSEALADVAAFVGRHIDSSRRHPNREEAMRHLAAATIRVFGPSPHAERLAEELRLSGVGDIRIGDCQIAPPTMTILLSTGGNADAAARFDPAPGATTLLVRLGQAEAHIGPLLVDGLTACPACVARTDPHPAGEPGVAEAALWLGTASLYAFLALTLLPSGLTLRGFRVQRMEGGAMTEETRLAIRLPGCPRCAIPGENWSPEDPRMLPWIYHCATSIPSRSMLSPKDHQGHYLQSNAILAERHERLLWSASSECLSEIPISGEDVGGLGAAALAALLVRIAGEVEEGASRRRLVPTGGNLGSVNLWVIVRNVVGLDAGAYLYDARREALDFVRPVDDEALRTALRSDISLPDCIIVGAGALAKCAQKYQAFAYRLIHLDAGVAIAFAHLGAGAMGLTLQEYADFDPTLPGIFGVPARWEIPLPTFALGLRASAAARDHVGDARLGKRQYGAPVAPGDYSFDMLPKLLREASRPSPKPTAQRPISRSPAISWAPSLEALDRVLIARRAVREYAPTPLTTNAVKQVLIAAHDALDRRSVAGAPTCFVRPVLGLAIATDILPAGLYEIDRSTGDLHRRGAFGPTLAEECSNQRSLAAAPVSLFMIGDMRGALDERGARGYAELALHAGAAVGAAWLRATSLGLVGTAAGGVVADGLRQAAGMDGFNECPLLALHLGVPAI